MLVDIRNFAFLPPQELQRSIDLPRCKLLILYINLFDWLVGDGKIVDLVSWRHDGSIVCLEAMVHMASVLYQAGKQVVLLGEQVPADAVVIGKEICTTYRLTSSGSCAITERTETEVKPRNISGGILEDIAERRRKCRY